MNVTNCRSCGRLFNVLGREKICPNCKQELEDKFQEVKKYLNENPNASMEQVSRDNEVSVKQIKQCGALIRTGRFCDSCKAHIQNNLMSAIDKPKAVERKKPTHEKDRMRFLQN